MLNRAKPHLNLNKIIETISSVDLTDEKHIVNFENRFKKQINAPFCKAINKGRHALSLALKILNISKGDEVIVQSFICKVALDAILSSGATPVLVDSSLDDFNILSSEIKEKINSKTKAIIIVHLYGIPCNMDEILYIAKENNCYLIEDCAHCINSKYNGRKVGSFGDISFFSFNFDKPLSTGNGGMLVVNNKQLLDKSKAMLNHLNRLSIEDDKKIVYGLFLQHLLTSKQLYNNSLSINFGQKLIEKNHEFYLNFDKLIKKKTQEKIIMNHIVNFLDKENNIREKNNIFLKGFNLAKKIMPFYNLKEYKNIKLMNSVRAIIGCIELDFIDDIDEIRCNNSQLYKEHLKDDTRYKLPHIDNKKKPVYLRYTVLNKTDKDISYISNVAKNKGFEIGNFNWPKPIHLKFPYNKVLKFRRSELKNSENLASNIINLPVHYYVKNQDLINIIHLLESF